MAMIMVREMELRIWVEHSDNDSGHISMSFVEIDKWMALTY